MENRDERIIRQLINEIDIGVALKSSTPEDDLFEEMKDRALSLTEINDVYSG